MGTERVVYVSTGGAAYGDTDVLPTPEEHPTRATSPYGVSKVAAERYLECFAGLASMAGLTLRLANVYGPRQRPDGEAGVVAIFARRLLAGQRCTVYGDGEQTRDYVYVADVAEAAEIALSQCRRPVSSTSRPGVRPRSMRSTGRSPPRSASRASPSTPRRGRARCAGACWPTRGRGRCWAGQPRNPLERGIGATLEWMRTVITQGA